MKIHEYQAKELLSRYGLPVPSGRIADSPESVRNAAKELLAEGVQRFVIKAQVHTGGRGKAGGIRLADSLEELEEYARNLIGSRLVTHQTGPEGKLVRKVLIEPAVNIASEYYVAVIVDRERQIPIVMASREGGVEIEEVAAQNPEAIFQEPLWGMTKLYPFQARRLCERMGFKGDQAKQFVRIVHGLIRAFWELDASLVEVNPLVWTRSDQFVLLDAKVNFDDNGLFRHPDVQQMRDIGEEDPLEVRASEARLNYIRLDGNIGCMVNGAGLAMATMDIIKLAGGEPANFLDVGGGASKDQIAEAFRILMADPRVKAVLINIFGGILRVDRLARGVVDAAQEVDIRVPIVIRVEGTNVEEGRRILQESGLAFTVAEDMSDAAHKVVELARGT